jgi:AcrR family transcriptional regulator
MGTKERRERERAEVREKILEAARALFVSEGYEAVTMRKIAERIEYSPTAIYLHFKDKETVLRELCDADFIALAQKFRKIGRIADPIERLKKAAHAYTEFGLEHPNHYQLMFMTPHPPIDKSESQVEKGNPEEDAYAFLKAAVDEAMAGGRFRSGLDDPDLVAQTLWAGLHGVVALQIAKANDPWCDWRSTTARSGLMTEVLVRGLIREGE